MQLKTKRNYYLGFGFAGGCVGSLLSELVTEGKTHSFFVTLVRMAGWGAIFAAVITLALVWAGEKYNRRPKFPKDKAWSALWSGALAGCIGSGVAQAVYSLHLASTFWTHIIFQSGCWGIAGMLIGWRLSRFIINMPKMKAIIGGLLGGFIGGMAFLLSSSYLPEVLGRMLGLGILGAALGLIIVMAEKFMRSASLDVLWAPNEMTTVTLGEMPVSIGGGDDHIYVDGLPQNAVRIVIKNGAIICTKAGSGQEVELKDGSQINIGTIKIKVNVTT